jgi:hypothetical protein
MKRYLVIAACIFAVGPVRAAESLGRLFFTPPQRAQLDVARSQKSRVTLASENQQEAAPAPEIITYSGVVRRSDGRSTILINNKPVSDGQAINGVPLSGSIGANGTVTLRMPQSDRPVELKVGQSLEIVSGTIEEPFSRSATAPQPAGPESAAGKPVPGKPPAPGEKAAATAGTPEQKVREAQPESALERLRPTRPEGNGNAPDRR